MTVARVSREINMLGAALLESGVALSFEPPTTERYRGGMRVGVPSSSLVLGVPLSAAHYTEILRRRAYTFVLYDASVIQVGFTLRGGEIMEHRLQYIPCPFDLADVDLDEWLADMSIEDVLAVLGSDRFTCRGTLRFDFSPGGGGSHPVSHVHLNDSPGRIGVFGPLSLGHFIQFVFRTFYPSAWAKHEFLRRLPTEHPTRCIRPHEEAALFLEQRPGVEIA